MRAQSLVHHVPFTLSLLFCLAVTPGCSCGSLVPFPAEPELEPELGPEIECRRSFDCRAGAVCNEGLCLQILCRDDDDCGAESTCDLPTAICIPTLVCDEDNPCADGERCTFAGGRAACVIDDAPAQTECQFVPETLIVRHGQARNLVAVSYDLESQRRWQDATFTFESDDESTVLVESGGALALCAADSACTTTVHATDQLGATCSTNVFVLPPVADETFEIVVVAPESHAPIADAEVTLVFDDAVTVGTTDADGRAVFDVPAETTIELASVFAAGRRWQSIAEPPGDDVLLMPPLELSPGEVRGVVIETELDDGSTFGDISFNLAGVGSFDPLQDWGPKELRGELRVVEIELEGITNGPIDATFDSATQIMVGTIPFHGSAFVPVSDFRRRTVWAMGSKVPLADMGGILSGSLSDFSLPFSEYAARFLDLGIGTRRLEPQVFSSIAEATASTGGPGTAVGSDSVAVETFRHRSALVSFPRLPCRDGFDALPGDTVRCRSNQFVSNVLVIVGARQANGEFVVLGIGSGQDVNSETGQPDGQISRFNSATDDGTDSVVMRWAPGHNAVEEDDLYAMLATDIDDDVVEADNVGDRVWTKVEDNTITFSDFPTPPAGRWAVNESHYTPTSSSPAGLQRLRLEGDIGGWDVFFSAAESPIAPLAGTGTVSAEGRLQVVYTESYSLEAATPKDIFQVSETNLDTLSDVATSRSGRRCVPQFGQSTGRRCLME